MDLLEFDGIIYNAGFCKVLIEELKKMRDEEMTKANFARVVALSHTIALINHYLKQSGQDQSSTKTKQQ